MATVWQIHTEDDVVAVASTPEAAINWLLGHEYARLDDHPFIEVYNEDRDKWEYWPMAKIAEYLGCSPMEVLKKLVSGDYDEDIIAWDVWLEEVDWAG